MSHKVLVSRCLLGHPVRYDGGASGPYDRLAQWQAQGRVVALCPEVAGGLPTPRAPAEIPGGQGTAVLDGTAPVVTIDGDRGVCVRCASGVGIGGAARYSHCYSQGPQPVMRQPVDL